MHNLIICNTIAIAIIDSEIYDKPVATEMWRWVEPLDQCSMAACAIGTIHTVSANHAVTDKFRTGNFFSIQCIIVVKIHTY